MFRVIEPVEIDFVTKTSVAETRRTILEALHKQGGKIKVDSPNDIVAGFGSGLKVRLLGVALVGTNSSPRDIVIKLYQRENKTAINVTVRDTLGFGSRAGYADKLQQIMYQQALDIKSQFADADSEPAK
jgi:hypothetical protein